MHCSNCGQYVAPGIRYCAQCGSPAVDPEVTKVARTGSTSIAGMDDQDLERTIFSARPTLFFIKLGYGAAVIGAILLTILLALIPGLNIPPYVSIPIAVALLLIPAFYHAKRNLIRYTLTDSKIQIDEGFVSRTTRNIPLRNIQDVTVSMTLMQRLLGFGNLIVENASEEGGILTLHNIDKPRHYADLLLRQLRHWR